MWFFSNKKQKGGYVYVGETTRKDGSKKIYTGMTRRSPYIRWGEHMSGNGGKYTSSGISFRPIGAVWSTNPRKAEKTIKKMSSKQKRKFGRAAAAKYYRKKSIW
jgi:predicted GIY-YIG superfamily endonuclease